MTIYFTRLLAAGALACALFSPLAASAAAGSVSTQIYGSKSTTTDFFGRRIQVPGTWVVTTGSGTVSLTRTSPTPSFLKFRTMPKEQCAYQTIRIAGQKAWGGKNAEQSTLRLNPVVLGRSKYQGYTWVMPGGTAGEKHWCIQQSQKVSAEIIVSLEDPAVAAFAEKTLLLQLAVRKGI
jgi:hypothetical protein